MGASHELISLFVFHDASSCVTWPSTPSLISCFASMRGGELVCWLPTCRIRVDFFTAFTRVVPSSIVWVSGFSQ